MAERLNAAVLKAKSLVSIRSRKYSSVLLVESFRCISDLVDTYFVSKV
jgi:hypothetical protein